MPDFSFLPACYPENPGCYLMKNARGNVLYVGKAKNLRRRLAQYFQPHSQRGKITRLVNQIRQIDVILVTSEVESLVLENILIKHYRPRFNVMLNSEQHDYGYLVLTDEPYPRLLSYFKHRINRQIDRSGGGRGVALARRFGPYLTREIRDKLMKCISETFGLRVCDPLPGKACFLYHLGRCLAPCEGFVTTEEYQQAVDGAAHYLESSHTVLIEHLTARMEHAADTLRFELAGNLRDLIRDLQTVFARQAVERDVKHDQDVIYLQEGRALILHLQRGALTDVEWISSAPQGENLTENLQTFIAAYYNQHCPPELIVSSLPDSDNIAADLAHRTGHPVVIRQANQGPAHDLLYLAKLNFQYRQTVEDNCSTANAAG